MFTNSCSKLAWRVEDGLYGVIPYVPGVFGDTGSQKVGVQEWSGLVWSGLWCVRFVS